MSIALHTRCNVLLHGWLQRAAAHQVDCAAGRVYIRPSGHQRLHDFGVAVLRRRVER